MNDEYMKMALTEAKKAFKNKEIPVGAIIVCENKIIAKAFNKKSKKNNVIMHAEILAITKASKYLKNWRLEKCQMYVTLEPCPMCASAIKQARIEKLCYGALSKDKNNTKVIEQIFDNNYSAKKIVVEKGIMQKECSSLIELFFKKKRTKLFPGK